MSDLNLHPNAAESLNRWHEMIRTGNLKALPELLEPGVFPASRPVDEEAGCHVVPLGGDEVLISAAAPRTVDRLADLGFTPRVVDISEFEKLEGCVTCLSVLIPGPHPVNKETP